MLRTDNMKIQIIHTELLPISISKCHAINRLKFLIKINKNKNFFMENIQRYPQI